MKRIKRSKEDLKPAIRVAVPTRKVFKDKSKYSRRPKHQTKY